ncbi:hypothetical protein ACNUY4_004456 [Salmonella enterica]|nr:hypothetical protein [Salmonella enterica]
MISMKLILVSLISIFSYNVKADTFYGTLRGENIIELKSPFSGVIKHNLSIDGAVHENISPVTIKSYELESKKQILSIKINTLKTKVTRLSNEYNGAKSSYERGFISRSELYQKQDAINEAQIMLQELKIEYSGLMNMLELGEPIIKKKYLIREYYTVNNQVVNSGDRLVSIETVDNFFIDIKFDPVSMKGKIQDKEISVKSLVTGRTGKAFVFKVSNPVDNKNTHGSKVASLRVTTDSSDLPQLLDTVFEVNIYDKN